MAVVDQWSGKGWNITASVDEVVISNGRRTTTVGDAFKRARFTPLIAAAVVWESQVTAAFETGRLSGRWICTETVDTFEATRPTRGLAARLRAAGWELQLSDVERRVVEFLEVDLKTLVVDANNKILETELTFRREFFDTIEKSPLTTEQASAVVCFDNRVQVLAAAGSGKTSVMVARAAYAVARGFVAPERILLLAFNTAAAAELQDRVKTRFAEAGIDATGLKASTFHAFGLELLGQATGCKPRVAPWVADGDVEMVLRIVSDLRDSSPTFGYRWDRYRLLFANAPTNLETDEPDGYDSESRQSGYRTFAGEVVRSHGERLIANFMYLNHVDYVYENPYTADVADAEHSQYRPDFYYPAIDAWHEHWALDRNGKPSADFVDYAEGMEWKRLTHAAHGTTLVESTWAGVMFGSGLEDLQSELAECGLRFDWDPERPIKDQHVKPIADAALARLVRTFMRHVKSRSLTRSDLEGRLSGDRRGHDGYRTHLFLEIYWEIHDEWDRRLAADRSIDFEYMLVQAADLLESDQVNSPYELVMVDEFQDASHARARMVHGLVKSPGHYLLAVGDDWQAINRFNGADLSVMTNFESWFGRGPQLALTKTFRCTQAICDVAAHFVTQNPMQIPKPMESNHPGHGKPITLLYHSDAQAAITDFLDKLSEDIATGAVVAGPTGTITVDVLGRYHSNRKLMPMPTKVPKNITINFRTVHGAKGLEADYIIVPALNAGTYGFPNTIIDDPVLNLAMPSDETFPHAEERRLLYVALTRARREVLLITHPERPSLFAEELNIHQEIYPDVVTENGGTLVKICPECKLGNLVPRTGPSGAFLACTAFPKCTYTCTQKQ